ncbi:protein of unknown function [Paenibacillus alvei]|uniref:Uncharacterized protein n=1 Tax=Paenibacillus alvei TaxID=44250 RepID=A0A383R3A9_PAEAL|nr:protein of unknown function [Paenibacillus alvei]
MKENRESVVRVEEWEDRNYAADDHVSLKRLLRRTVRASAIKRRQREDQGCLSR